MLSEKTPTINLKYQGKATTPKNCEIVCSAPVASTHGSSCRTGILLVSRLRSGRSRVSDWAKVVANIPAPITTDHRQTPPERSRRGFSMATFPISYCRKQVPTDVRGVERQDDRRIISVLYTC